MLKTIPPSFTPDLLRMMMAMGHGEELLIADGNFPSMSTGAPSIPRIYVPVADMTALFADILKFFPLDETVESPLAVMESARESGAYAQYRAAADRAGIKAPIAMIERFAFYERAAGVAGIVITSSQVKGGNILMKKGVVRDNIGKNGNH
ncbi:MAG: fucose isomerase [Treponema sp.]|nr:fucose isomerase [Treponema sp.]